MPETGPETGPDTGPDTGAARHIAIIGGGSIGVSFALVFARAGFDVRLHEISAERRAVIPDEIQAKLLDLKDHGLISGDLTEVIERITIHAALEDILPNARLAIECAPEIGDLKREIFARMEDLGEGDTLFASASSAIPISQIASDLESRARCFVAHPANPPHLLPIIELVPADFTDPGVIEQASEIFAKCGLYPAKLHHEIEGFVYNRLQGALLREAYCLVRDGIISTSDIDRLVRDGLGLRWSVTGPFETADLNTRGGISAHAQKLGPAYARMGAQRGQNDPWTDDLVEQVTQERRAALPLRDWEVRVRWRDVGLMKRLRLKLQE